MAYTSEDIRYYAKQQGLTNADGSIDGAKADSLYNAAKVYGVNEAQLDEAFGLQSGTAANWIKTNNKQSLTATPAKAPDPAPDITPPKTSAADPPAAPSAPPVTAPPALVVPPTTSPDWSGALSELSASNKRLADQLSAPRAAAQQVTYDESKGVQGRVSGITAENGPLMQQARADGLREANRRGVLNSSAGVRSAQQAIMDKAYQIAAADAGLYSNTQLANMQEANRWNTAADDRTLQQLIAGQNTALNYAKMGQDESQFSRTYAESVRVADMDFSLQDRRLTQDDRQFLQTMGLERQKLATQIDQFAKTFGLSTAELELNKNKLSQDDRQFYDGLKIEQAKLDQQGQQFKTEWDNRFSLEKLASSNRIDLANIDASNRKDLMTLEATYKTEIAGNETISNAWGTVMQQIGQIQNNPDLDKDAKATLISNVTNGFDSFTKFWKKASGGTVDVSDLLDFGPTAAATAATVASTQPPAQPEVPTLAW